MRADWKNKIKSSGDLAEAINGKILKAQRKKGLGI